MKKKFLAMALAAGLCFTTAAAPAYAGVENIILDVDWAERDTDFVRFNALNTDVDVTAIYGVTLTITCADMSAGVGGGIIINTDTNGWDQKEWGNADAGKEISLVPTDNADEYTLTRMSDTPMFDASATYANICLSHWWGGDITVIDCDFLDADGNILGAAAADEPAVDEPAVDEPADEAANESDTEDTSVILPQTGVVSTIVFLASGAMMVFGGAALTKKKED